MTDLVSGWGVVDLDSALVLVIFKEFLRISLRLLLLMILSDLLLLRLSWWYRFRRMRTKFLIRICGRRGYVRSIRVLIDVWCCGRLVLKAAEVRFVL